ncbi:MAG: FGGY-family carbohydrate kinase [Clostridia bacterium]|nr:FGGY-family carbohydrate kinase [Clostridia bacterium]
MGKLRYAISYDIGTTGVKTCIFSISDTIELVSGASAGYNLYVLDGGGAEQDPSEWWHAMCRTTGEVLADSGISPEQIEGVSFCSQMQGLVLTDKNGEPVRRAMSYMDQRATEQLRKGIAHGPQIAGANIFKLLKSLAITGAVAASVKDPVWKYKWVEENEPENFKRAHKWLDVKEFLICKMTGEFVMTPDSAFATLLYDIKKECWSKPICDMLGVNMAHLPEIKDCTAKVGELTAKAASELGLKAGTAVFGGGGDASLIGVASGAVAPGETHLYWGTSGWAGTVTTKSVVDTNAMIAAIVGADKGRFLYFAELETAGKCYEWVKNNVVSDRLGLYASHETALDTFDCMGKAASEVNVGSDGVIFAPWLHGNRCPFEDPKSRGMFFNLNLETGKAELVRAVIEGVSYHLRWFIETQDKKVETSSVVRFAGGGARSDVVCQILADILGRKVEVPFEPHNVGAAGAAVVTAVGLGVVKDIQSAKKLIAIEKSFKPDMKKHEEYNKFYNVYTQLYKTNKKLFHQLNK